ncbi:hypothetical protein N4G58_08595 [Edwardsiella piscicida]|nr:hypothetical protein N4G58_08595 [Edwardsiella piscicida]
MLLPPALLALAPRVAFLLAGCAVLLLAQQGFITLPAVATLALMALLLSLRQRFSPRWRGISEIALLLGIIALYKHDFPGFHNPLLLDRVSAGPHSAPFTLYANLDKALVPLLLLALYPTLLRRPGVSPQRRGAGESCCSAYRPCCCWPSRWAACVLNRTGPSGRRSSPLSICCLSPWRKRRCFAATCNSA